MLIMPYVYIDNAYLNNQLNNVYENQTKLVVVATNRHWMANYRVEAARYQSAQLRDLYETHANRYNVLHSTTAT